jgi:oxalyl-CoA decarboxylase
MENKTNSTSITNGFHLVVEAMQLYGLDTIYGVAGIPVTDLMRLAQAKGMRYIGFRHEQSAGNAAAIAGYLTQKQGICLTVSAPGFLNGMVALANPTTNGFPMIQISGSSDRALVDLQQGEYEELDQMNAAKPYAKAAYRVDRAEDIGIGLARAIRAAVSGRPGGVYLDLPGDVLAATLDAETAARSLVRVVDAAPRQLPPPEAVQRALEVLATAERPLIIIGRGAAYAQADADIRAFIEETGIPFQPMSMAKGLLPDDHPQSTAAARSYALAQADVVMLIGARLNWLLGHGKSPQWSPTAQFVQLDIEPTEMRGRRAATSAISTRRAVFHRNSEGQGSSRGCLSVPARTGRMAAPANRCIRKGEVSLWRTRLRWLKRSSNRSPMPLSMRTIRERSGGGTVPPPPCSATAPRRRSVRSST